MSPKAEAQPDRLRFAKALVQKRRERGFATAYAFFHKTGGQKHFGFSYNYYLLVERGLRLPSEGALELILDVLSAKTVFYEERRALLTLYVKALLGGNPLFDPVFEAAAAARPAAGPAPATLTSDRPEDAILRIAGVRQLRKVPRMSVEQVTALTSEPAAFWVAQWLLQTGRTGTDEQLASDLSLPRESVAAITARLGEAELLKRRKDGSWYSPYFETDLFEPLSTMGSDKSLWFSERIQERIRQTQRPHFYNYYLLSVETDDRIKLLVDLCREISRKAYLLRERKPARGGALVALETRVCPIVNIPPSTAKS
jgi:hypothetical protein